MEAVYAMETLLLEETSHHTSDWRHSSRSRAAAAPAGLGEFFPLQICRQGEEGVTPTETSLVRLALSYTCTRKRQQVCKYLFPFSEMTITN